MSIIPIIFFALLFGFGSVFGSSGTVTQEAVPVPVPSAAAASPVVPGTAPSQVQLPAKLVRQMFTYRESLPSCDSWPCLQDAADAFRDGRGPTSSPGAELVQTATTTEGDPITTYYRVSRGELEIFTDRHHDSFRGGPAWAYQSCPIPVDVRSECTGS